MSNSSLASRAVAALLLTIGFYVLAVGVAAGLLAGVYFELVYSSHIWVKPTLFAVIAAVVILWSILPRFDRFEAPGPRLTESDQPEIFGILREISTATEQEMPAELYLLSEVNAWVAQRGGIAGIGSRRVMGLGLPLMQTLTIPQFRAVIGHEFGHYHAGDTKLGPWIYKTRQAIGRTITNLVKSRSSVHQLFVWYGNFFMKVTQAISRAQELAADRLAAEIAGARNLIDGLVSVHRADAAYKAYWREEVLPLLDNGFRPPFAMGLSHFMSVANVERQLGEIVERELSEGKAGEFDSHPPLRERIAALQALPVEEAEPAPLAATLFRNLDSVEWELLKSLFVDPARAAALQRVSWEESGERAFLPVWRKVVEGNRDKLRNIPFDRLRFFTADLPALARDLGPLKGVETPESLIGCAFAVRLCDDGYRCDSRVGEAFDFEKNGKTLQPFLIVQRMVKHEVSPDEWSAICAEHGLAGRHLVDQ